MSRSWILPLSLAIELLSAGCKKEAPASYPPPQQVVPAPALTPAAAQQPTVFVAPAGPALSQPNPLALACTIDAHCLTHRCNTAVGKCAWPCQTDNDCIPGNVCIAPTCLPKLK